MSGFAPTPLFLDPAYSDLEPPEWFRAAMDVPRQEGVVEVDGCPIHYFEWGDRSKPSLIMVHGFLAHVHCLVFIAPFLVADYHIVAMDMSGMGDSGAREGYTIDGRADEMMQVAEHFDMFSKAKKPIIIAHSYGGAIGLGAMEAAADRFGGLVICDLMAMRPARLAAFFGSDDDRPRMARAPNRSNRVYPDYETAKGRFVLSPPQPVGEPYLFDYMAYHSLKQVEGGWTWKFDPSVFNRDDADGQTFIQTGQRIANGPGRKAVVYGEKSLLFDADSAAYIRELGGDHLPIISIPVAGHHLMLDQPIAFVTALKTILEHWRVEDLAKR